MWAIEPLGRTGRQQGLQMNFNFGRRGAATMLRALMLGGAAIGSLSTSEALAQTQIPAQSTDADATSDEVVITGSRPLAESEAASLLIQRQSDSIVSVLSADAIGRLPDQNIAFAIGRLPGVSIERDQGQARYVNLRGTPVYWNTLSFDGLSVVSPEGRSTRYDNIPSALAKQVIVTKAITADMPGDTVAGNVNILTRSALDYEDFTVFGNAALGYVTLGGGEEGDSSLVVADRFLDGKLGVLLQGSFYRRNMVTDNWETDPYLVNNTGGARFAREFENKWYRLTRQNQSLSARIDYEFNDDHEIFAQSFWTQFADEELRSNYIFRLDQGLTSNNQSFYTGNVARDTSNTPRQGTVFGANITSNTNSLESEEDSYINTLGGEHSFGGWDVSWRVNYTFTSDGRDAPALPNYQSPSGAANRPTVVYNFSEGENNYVELYRTVVTTVGGVTTLSRGERVFSVDNFATPLTNITRREGADITQAWTYKGDVERAFDLFGSEVVLKTGFLYSERSKKSRETSFTATAAQLTAAGINPATVFNIWRNSDPFQGDFGQYYTFNYHTKSAIDNFMADLVRRGIATRNNRNGAYWDVTEDLLGGYVMGTVERDWGNLVVGLRSERIENTGKAIVNNRIVTTASEETLYYPSAHLNVDVTDNWKVRVGVTSTASRPDFDDLRPNFSINDAAQSVSGGNPDAKPEKQIGLDAYVEFYPDGDGFFSAGLFYKDISDVLFVQLDTFGAANSAAVDPAVDRSGYSFSRIDNAGDGNLLGFEIYYSNTAQELVDRTGWWDWLGGFGVRASGTWIDSEVNIPAVRNAVGVITDPARTQRLLGTSDFTGNLQLTYEKYDLSVRLAYQYRTDWGQGYGSYITATNGAVVPNGNGDTFWDDDEELDLSVRYKFTDNFEVYFDGVNLTDQKARRFVDSSLYPIEVEQFGQRYLVGVRFNY